MAASTGLRQSELFALKWGDIDFSQNTMNVTRSIAYGIVGRCKTEASQKPVPVHSILAAALILWRDHCKYREPDDWVFANEHHRGRHPYWGQAILRRIVRPLAERIGIRKRIGCATRFLPTPTRRCLGAWGRNSKSCRNSCGIPRYGPRLISTLRRSRRLSTRHRPRS